MGVRGAREHDQRTGIAHDGRQTGGCGVERPDDHPVRTNWDRRARAIERIGIAVLSSSIEHVDKSGCGVRRFWLFGPDVEHPTHPMGSKLISACPIIFSLPGTHTHWFVPGRSTVIFP